MRHFLLAFFLLLPSISLADLSSSDSSSPSILPECPFIDPTKELEEWTRLPIFPSKCNVTKDKPEEGTGEHEIYEKGVHR
jgi:hypothetical protein